MKPINFDDHDCDLARWPRDRLDAETLAAQDPDHVTGLAPRPVQHTQLYQAEPPHDDDLDELNTDDSRVEMRWLRVIGWAVLLGIAMWVVGNAAGLITSGLMWVMS